MCFGLFRVPAESHPSGGAHGHLDLRMAWAKLLAHLERQPVAERVTVANEENFH